MSGRLREGIWKASIQDRSSGAGQVGTGQVRTGQVQTGRLGTGQARTGQVRTGQAFVLDELRKANARYIV